MLYLIFNRVKLDERKWESVIEESDQKLKFINDEFERFTNKILLSKFDENQMHVNFFKNIKIDSLLECMSNNHFESFLDSKIINESLVAKSLEELLRKKDINGRKWSLLYQASRDGFKGSDFHSHCDDKPNTLTIVKSKNDNIFGGYTSTPWESTQSNSWKSDMSAFIFSVVNKENRPLLFEQQSVTNYSTCSHKSAGPIFGIGNDLIILDNSTVNLRTNRSFLETYTNPEYPKGSEKERTILAGTNDFEVQEVEVFQMQIQMQN